MTISVTLNNVANLQDTTTAQTTINNNNASITAGFTTALNTAGDQMQGNLDMNNSQILNLPSPATAHSPLRLADIGTVTVNPAIISGSNVYTGNNSFTGTSSFALTNTTTANATTINATTINATSLSATSISSPTISSTTFNANTITLTGPTATSVATITFNGTGQGTIVSNNASGFGISSAGDIVIGADSNVDGSGQVKLQKGTSIGLTVGGLTTTDSGVSIGSVTSLGAGTLNVQSSISSPSLTATTVLITGTGSATTFNAGTLSASSLTVTGSTLVGGSLGYNSGVGAGTSVTQGTSRTTGVTTNHLTGNITLFSTTGVTNVATFTVTNSFVGANDIIILTQRPTISHYQMWPTGITSGSFNIDYLMSTGATSTTESPVVNFAIIKGAAN